MFDYVDRALDRLICDRIPGVHLAFAAPTPAWTGQAPDGSVNVYLYDVCEDLERRQAGSVRVREQTSRQVLETEPPRYARLSYLLSAWAASPQDAHGLLGQLFVALAHVRSLDLGSNCSDGGAVLEVGRPWDGDRTHAELWNALDNTLPPSLRATVSVPLPVYGDPAGTPAVRIEPVVTVLPEVKTLHAAGRLSSGAQARTTASPARDLS
ncbi:Pvc16 family protein [Streptomyces sp. NPDC048161]|uniref:Pvc16 family protein n=1 Tax=Streptomyces sp. NPDC048161 TaxID=3160985 RepID=UPI0033EBEEFD